jgi:hypothetical protein
VHGGVFLKICDVNEQVIGAGNVLRPLKRLIGVLMAMLSVTNVCVSSRRENSFLNTFSVSICNIERGMIVNMSKVWKHFVLVLPFH